MTEFDWRTRLTEGSPSAGAVGTSSRRHNDHATHRVDRLGAAASVLANLSEASRDGRGLDDDDLLEAVEHGALLESALTALTEARFVALDRWVLIRDLDATPLFALLKTLDFTLGHGVESNGGEDAKPWRTRLDQLLEQVNEDARRCLSGPLKPFLMDG